MKNAPIQAPYPVADFMQPVLSEVMQRMQCVWEDDPIDPKPSCVIPIYVSIFFDGTNNNMDRDRPHGSHSNIVKLFNAHKQRRENRIFKVYVPGVGTRFPGVGEHTESQMGKAAGEGGQARILWALIQVYNSVYRAFRGSEPMLDDEQTRALIKRYVNEVDHHRGNDGMPTSTPPSRKEWFGKLSAQFNGELKKAITNRYPVANRVIVSVFGFSRGAVQAQAFCHWFADAAAGGNFAGIPAIIRFVGLFDSVASVGLADSVRKTTPLWFADGHWDWAAEVLKKPLPSMVQKVVHYVAAHEQRMKPFMEIEKDPDLKADFDVSADLATAWERYMRLADAESKRMCVDTRDGGGEMPIVAAQEKGEPAPEEESRTVPESVPGEKKAEQPESTYATLVKLHMGLYYMMRGYLNDNGIYEQTYSFKAAGPQDQEDLRSYNGYLRTDVKLLEARIQGIPEGVEPTFDDESRRWLKGNQLPLILARERRLPDPWEKWALERYRAWPSYADIDQAVL